MNTIVRFWIAIVLLLSQTLCGQTTFTRVTDPANPIVTDQFESGGGTWIDINNDGWPDLFVANGNLTSQNNSMYLNLHNGNFRKIITGAIVSDGGSSIGSTWGDYDNDGKLDVFVTNRNNFGNFLYRATGDTLFTKITTGNPVTDIANSNSSSWVDINGDGYLDLFVVNFQGNNFLYYNSGLPNFVFARVDSGAIVLDGSNFSIAGAWGDYNNDRRPDLFIGNAGTQNDLLFTNQGNGRFTQTTFSDGRSTLGASWGDYNNDGYLDLFVANYLNQNNILYRNSGPPNYTLVPVDTGVVSNDGGNSVGSVWGDVDNDGDLDLFVANDGGVCSLYLNNGPPNYDFTKVTTGELVNTVANSFGCAAADYDNDGALDLFIANRLNQRSFLYKNDGNSNTWVTIKCVGVTSNKAGIGTTVRIKATIGGTSRWQMQEVAAQTGYNSQNLLLHFGFGNATIIDSVKIEWPNGQVDAYNNVPVDRIVVATEGTGLTAVNEKHGSMPTNFELLQNYPNPFNPTTMIGFRTQTPGFTTLRVFDVLGQEVRTILNSWMNAGHHEVMFDASGLASGVYCYLLQTDALYESKRMVVLK